MSLEKSIYSTISSKMWKKFGDLFIKQNNLHFHLFCHVLQLVVMIFNFEVSNVPSNFVANVAISLRMIQTFFSRHCVSNISPRISSYTPLAVRSSQMLSSLPSRARPYWRDIKNLATAAITQVPRRTLKDILVTSLLFGEAAAFFENLLQGVSFRTNLNSASTRLAGVDSLQVSSSRTTHASSLSMSLQFSSLITKFGRLSTVGMASPKYPPMVLLTQSCSASCFELKHSGPSSAMKTKKRRRVTWLFES